MSHVVLPSLCQDDSQAAGRVAGPVEGCALAALATTERLAEDGFVCVRDEIRFDIKCNQWSVISGHWAVGGSR